MPNTYLSYLNAVRERDWAAMSKTKPTILSVGVKACLIVAIQRIHLSGVPPHTHSNVSDGSSKLMLCVGDLFLGTWRATLGTVPGIAAPRAQAEPSGQTTFGTEGDSLLFYACVML